MPPKPTKQPLLSYGEQNIQSGSATSEHPNSTDHQSPIINVDSEPDNKPIYYRSSSRFRWVVLSLSCFLTFGSYFCYDNPTALAKQLQIEYNLTDTKYNLLYSVYSFPNMILPLFGGALIDKIGSQICLLIFLSLVTGGQALFAFAASIHSYPLMLIARTIFGLGGESFCVSGFALLAVYFGGEQVAFAMGLYASLGRVGSALNDYVTLKIYNIHHSIPEALFAGFLLLCICLCAAVVMVILDALRTKHKRKQGYIVPKSHSGEMVNISDIKQLNILYWLITISCVVVYGCVIPWNNIGSAFMQSQYDMSAKEGNKHLMIPYLISAVCVPIFGYICDTVGKRAELFIVSAVMLTATHCIFTWFVWIEPIIPLVLMGVAYSIYASAIWPSVSLIVKQSRLGTAYGIISVIQNSGLALYPIVVAQLTDCDAKEPEFYFVEMFFFGLGCFGVVIGVSLWCLDNARGAQLSKPSKQKENT